MGCQKVSSRSRYCHGRWRPILFAPSALRRRSTDWSATVRPSTCSGFRRVHPGGATTGPLPSGHPRVRASVGFIPAEPQLVRYRQAIHVFGLPSGSSRRSHNWSATVRAIHVFGLPSGSSRRSHNWSATVRPSTCSGFRRVHPGGATTGPLPFGPSTCSGFRRVHPGGATTGPLPSGPSTCSGFRRVHPGGATTGPLPFGPSTCSGFRRVHPGGATTGPLPSLHVHRRSSPQCAITPARLRDPVKPRPAWASAGSPLCLRILGSAGTLCGSSAVAGPSAALSGIAAERARAARSATTQRTGIFHELANCFAPHQPPSII